jgi:hypothetical protein
MLFGQFYEKSKSMKGLVVNVPYPPLTRLNVYKNYN